MTRRVLRALHAITLGLMVFLAGASNCFSESYDPDPWDDTPPITVEFDYVLPRAAGMEGQMRAVRTTHCGISAPGAPCDNKVHLHHAASRVGLDELGSPRFGSLPLRR